MTTRAITHQATPVDYSLSTLEEIRDSWLSTGDLMWFALSQLEYTTDPYATGAPVWTVIDSTEDDAIAFYKGLLNGADHDREHLRQLAAEALASTGWTMSAINHKKS